MNAPISTDCNFFRRVAANLIELEVNFDKTFPRNRHLQYEILRKYLRQFKQFLAAQHVVTILIVPF